jgi:hypothetical protein
VSSDGEADDDAWWLEPWFDPDRGADASWVPEPVERAAQACPVTAILRSDARWCAAGVSSEGPRPPPDCLRWYVSTAVASIEIALPRIAAAAWASGEPGPRAAIAAQRSGMPERAGWLQRYCALRALPCPTDDPTLWPVVGLGLVCRSAATLDRQWGLRVALRFRRRTVGVALRLVRHVSVPAARHVLWLGARLHGDHAAVDAAG